MGRRGAASAPARGPRYALDQWKVGQAAPESRCAGAGQPAYSLARCSSHRCRSFCFIYGRRLEVRPQFRIRLWLDNYTLAPAEKGRHFIFNLTFSQASLGLKWYVCKIRAITSYKDVPDVLHVPICCCGCFVIYAQALRRLHPSIRRQHFYIMYRVIARRVSCILICSIYLRCYLNAPVGYDYVPNRYHLRWLALC